MHGMIALSCSTHTADPSSTAGTTRPIDIIRPTNIPTQLLGLQDRETVIVASVGGVLGALVILAVMIIVVLILLVMIQRSHKSSYDTKTPKSDSKNELYINGLVDVDGQVTTPREMKNFQIIMEK